MSVDVGNAVGYLQLDTSGFKKGFTSALADLEVFKDKAATTQDKMTAMGSAMTSTGASLTKWVTLPILGIGAASVATAAQFESKMSEVGAIAGATGSDMALMTNKAKEMGAKTKFSASESAEAMKYLAQAGWDAKQVVAGIPGVMDLAAASGESLASVADIVANSLTAFGLKAKDSAHFADVLAQAANKTNTSVGEIGESFKYVAPLAGTLGYSIEDISIALGLMANNGVKGSQAGTSLKTALANLSKPTKQMKKYMDELGITMTDSTGKILPFKDVMDELREKFRGLSKQQQVAAASAIFGKEAMSGMLAIINASPQAYADITQGMYNADGAASQMADTMQDNLVGQLTILKSTVEGIAISFGDIMLPTIKSVVAVLQNLANWINNLSEGQKTVLTTILAVVAAIGPMLLIGGKIVMLILSIQSLIATSGVALAAITGPIGIAIAAIAAFALAWTTNFGGIRQFVEGILKAIYTAIATILGRIRAIWNSNFLGMKDSVVMIFSAISIVLKTVLDVIVGIINIFLGIVTLNWKQVWTGIKQIFSGILTGIKNLFKLFLNYLVDTLIKIAAHLFVAAKQAFTGILQGFKTIWTAITEWFKKAVNDPVGAIKGIGTALYNAGKSIMHCLWDGMKAIWTDLKDWFKGIVDWIKSKVEFWKSEKSELEGDKKSVNSHSHANGLAYVPYDGYQATLHRGERVLTKADNEDYTNGDGGSGGDTYNFYSPTALTPMEAAKEMKKAKRDLALGY